MTSHHTLISYAMSFAAFIVDSPVGNKINKIILFGSVARGEFTQESDIDLFIDADPSLETEIEKVLTLFRTSQTFKTGVLKNIKNEISLKVGNLAHWSLRRQVISSGIQLYGKYSENIMSAKYYLLVSLEGISRKSTSQQMKIMRHLYGYTQKVGKKLYLTSGLLTHVGGKKIGRGVFIIPVDHRNEVLQFLNKNKINHSIYEIWSDNL